MGGPPPGRQRKNTTDDIHERGLAPPLIEECMPNAQPTRLGQQYGLAAVEARSRIDPVRAQRRGKRRMAFIQRRPCRAANNLVAAQRDDNDAVARILQLLEVALLVGWIAVVEIGKRREPLDPQSRERGQGAVDRIAGQGFNLDRLIHLRGRNLGRGFLFILA